MHTLFPNQPPANAAALLAVTKDSDLSKQRFQLLTDNHREHQAYTDTIRDKQVPPLDQEVCKNKRWW